MINDIRYIIKLNDHLYNSWGYIDASCIICTGKIGFFLPQNTFSSIEEASKYIRTIIDSKWYRKDITKDNFEIVSVQKYPEFFIDSFYLTKEYAEHLREQSQKAKKT